jgi:hypothetical protein
MLDRAGEQTLPVTEPRPDDLEDTEADAQEPKQRDEKRDRVGEQGKPPVAEAFSYRLSAAGQCPGLGQPLRFAYGKVAPWDLPCSVAAS